jgi:hypothetical protein
MMKNLQKMGGIAALYEAVAYLMGMVVFIFMIDLSSAVTPVEKVALLVNNQTILYTMHLLVYVLFSPFLVVLSLAIYERLKVHSPALMQTATVFGMIWACVVVASGMIYNIGMGNVVEIYATDPIQAGTVWLAIHSVFDGLGGGNEILGGIWLTLISFVALRAGEFAKALNYLGLLVGVAGILSTIPALGEPASAIFGLGQIVWFIWLGISMLRTSMSKSA